jgi:hypothetical protein
MGKVYASGDWHGNGELAKQVLDFLQPDDKLIFIGDAIDRGEDGYEIMTQLLSDKRVIYLKGNHEDMMTNFITHYLDGFHGNLLWYANGGGSTWDKMETLSDECLKGLAKKISSLPTEYIYKSPKGHKVILEHAGYTPFDTPHRSHDPLWDREHFYDRWCSGSGASARKHQCLYIAYQIPFIATCRAISPSFQSATYPASMSIGRIYVTTRSEYSR